MKKLLIAATLLLLLSLKPLFAGVDKGIDVAEVQKMLTELCIDAGPIDGVWGRKTEAAVKFFLYNYSGQFGENDMKVLKSHHWLFAKEKKCEAAKVVSIKPPSSDYIREVSREQWNIIKELGDPQNCENRIKKLNGLKVGTKISAGEFNNNSQVSNAQLFNKNKVIFFGDGTYKLKNTIHLYGKNLIGTSKTVIDASSVETAFRIAAGGLKNVAIINAERTGIDLLENSIVHNVIVDKTGVGFKHNSSGFGVNMTSIGSKNNCIVSVEVSNGYNNAGSNSATRNGGNADGFRITYGAHNVTFIDVHSHHNSDDGFDFWKGGHAADIAFDKISYRIFYSSSNLNGKKNGDGNGYKFGSPDNRQAPKKDAGSKFIYGSVACYNASNGFDRNKTRTKIIASQIQASGNRGKNYRKVSSNFKTDKDPNVLRCNMFPRK